MPPAARAWRLRGRGVLFKRRSLPLERLWGTATNKARRPTTSGTGRPAQAAVTAYGALWADGSPHRRRPASWVDGDIVWYGMPCSLGAAHP